MNCCICSQNIYTIKDEGFESRYYDCHTCNEGIVCSECQFKGDFDNCPICRTNWDSLILKNTIVESIDKILLKDRLYEVFDPELYYDLTPNLYKIILENAKNNIYNDYDESDEDEEDEDEDESLQKLRDERQELQNKLNEAKQEQIDLVSEFNKLKSECDE